MRNLFDQYRHPENRLTHALMTSLNEDSDLLRGFIKWATSKPAEVPTSKLFVLEQAFPQENDYEVGPEQVSIDEGNDGLPDGCIHDECGWALLIESKIDAPLTASQLQAHRRSARKHGLTSVHMIALVVKSSRYSHIVDSTVRQWTELYCWLKRQEHKSEWAKRLIDYMEILEEKLPAEGYLKEGALTVFTGVPFEKEHPYNYREAKRVLGLAMDELRKRKDIKKELRIDTERPTRSITGRISTSVWDFLPLQDAGSSGKFTEFPHLTLAIHNDYLDAFLIVPHAMRPQFRNNLIREGDEGFRELFEEILVNFRYALRAVKGAVPWVEIVQRHYPARRSEPIRDARLEFDLRTGFDTALNWSKSTKAQPHWLTVTYEALRSKKSNLQLGVGAKFHYDQCPATRQPEIVDHIASAWLACKPLLKKIVGR